MTLSLYTHGFGWPGHRLFRLELTSRPVSTSFMLTQVVLQLQLPLTWLDPCQVRTRAQAAVIHV